MELKLVSSLDEAVLLSGFNRTFMELKLSWWRGLKDRFYVLIAPLWN